MSEPTHEIPPGIIRTVEDVADFLVCEFEAQTGFTATDAHRADALEMAQRMVANPDAPASVETAP